MMNGAHRLAISAGRLRWNDDPLMVTLRQTGFSLSLLSAELGIAAPTLLGYRKPADHPSHREAPLWVIRGIEEITGFAATPENWPTQPKVVRQDVRAAPSSSDGALRALTLTVLGFLNGKKTLDQLRAGLGIAEAHVRAKEE